MTDIVKYINTITLRNDTYTNNTELEEVDLANVPWTNNSMRNAFYDCSNLTSVMNINENVTNMLGTFYHCTNLVNAPVIPNNVTYMRGAFSGCSNLTDAPVIPNSVTDLSAAFNECWSLVNIEDFNEYPNLTNLENTFAWCSNLVNAPNISNCPNLNNMTNTFRFCNLVNAPVISNCPNLKNMFSTFSECENLQNIPSIPGSVENLIGTFDGCSNLINGPLLPESITNMKYAFLGCIRLFNAPVIPNSVTDISSTFYNCNNLVTAPEIPNNVSNMYFTFANCWSLTGDIYIHTENITNAEYCFDSTSLNKDVYIPFKNGEDFTNTYLAFTTVGYPITEPRKNGVLLKNLNYNPLDDWRYSNEEIPGKTLLYEYIGSNTYITVPNDRTIINNYTSGETTTESNTPFFENQDVEYAELANVPWVNNSMAYAFYNDQNVRGIYNINTDVVNYFKAFWNCTNLTEITLPGSFFDEGSDISGAFEDCSNLRNITIIGNIGNATNISNTFNGTGIPVTPTLPNTIEDLAWAFANCFFLTNSGPIPTSAKNMQGTFYNCYNIIGAMDIHAPNLSDMSWTYWNCTNLVNVGSIPNNVTNMYQTYYNCSNMNMIPTIPTNVSNMAETFYNCQSITNIPEIHNKVTNMYGTFDGCISITGSIDIYSENIINVDNIFNNTSSLKDVYIPFTYDNGVNTSTYNAFIASGYSTDPSNRVNGVLLHDLNAFNFSDWETTRDENNNVRLTKYIGDRVNIIVPYLS